MSTTWKQVVLDTADAYREANGTTDKIPVGQLADKVRSGAGIPYEGENPLTIGSEGYTFPANTLLKDGLQIINGVSGEDLTETAANQTAAVNALLTMVKRKVAENNGEGEFVWKKLTAEGGDFVDYVISSDSEAYPDGGEQDGYWYELVEEGLNLPALFGCTDMAVDTFTVSSATLSENVTINHSLGKIPKIALIVKEDMNTTTNMFNYYLNGAFFFNRRQGTRAQVVTEWYSYSSTGWYNDHSASVYANNISSNSFIIYSVDSGSAARRFAASSYKVITMA